MSLAKLLNAGGGASPPLLAPLVLLNTVYAEDVQLGFRVKERQPVIAICNRYSFQEKGVQKSFQEKRCPKYRLQSSYHYFIRTAE